MHPIKQRRQAKGWAPSQLARRVGVTRESVWHWERGTLPKAQSLRKVAEVFEVDELDLVNELLNWNWQSAPRRS